MVAALEIPVTVAGTIAATACVVAGGPLFADGLRALRLRRMGDRLSERTLVPETSGLVHVRGRIALESPLFSPLSGRPCAGFVLDVRGEGTRVGGRTAEMRSFRLVGEEATARVVPEDAVWFPPVTAERRVAAGEDLPAGLSARLDAIPEARWLRSRGTGLVLTERAFESGAIASVVGVARHVRAHEIVDALRLTATGTDGMAAVIASSAVEESPDLWIEPGEPLDALVVSQYPPSPASLVPAKWRVGLALLGPALSMSGLVYLARAAGAWLEARV
jgi:hypothetical protein